MRPALLTPARLLTGIVALTILCMFAVAVVTDRLALASLSSGDFNTSSHIHLINDVNHAIKRAQDCRTAYLTTGNASYLDAYRAACTDVDFSMDRLVNEDAEVTAKLAHAQGLRQFMHTKLSEIGQMLAAKPAATSASPAVNGDLSRIQKLLGGLAQEESRDVSDGLEAASVRSAFHHNLVIALAAINILFFGGVIFCAVQIRKLHSLITVCAWSKKVQYQGKWVPLEEYMQNRFGIRISHGISKEEYDKWASADTTAESIAQDLRKSNPLPAHPETPKAAA
jgi:CHASE3 domain sensor protein